MAQYAYNTLNNEDIKMSPFFANYGFNPRTTNEPIPGLKSPEAFTETSKLAKLQQKLKSILTFLQDRMKKYANTKRIEGPILKRGSKVYLI